MNNNFDFRIFFFFSPVLQRSFKENTLLHFPEFVTTIMHDWFQNVKHQILKSSLTSKIHRNELNSLLRVFKYIITNPK